MPLDNFPTTDNVIAAPALCGLLAPPEFAFPSHRVAATRHSRYHQPPRMPLPTVSPFAIENFPGTPPLRGDLVDPATDGDCGDCSTTTSALAIPALVRASTAPEDRPKRDLAARVLQRAVRCALARRARARLVSAIGRPAEISVTTVTNLEMLCDFRDVQSVYCIVRVLKKPFGPFMFEFQSSRCTHVPLPTWDASYFVPMLSSRCAIVVTLVGVNPMDRCRFLGQAVAPLETGWELAKETELVVPLGKWTFPVDDTLIGLHRFVTGNVHCRVKPLSARNTCLSGQFQMLPTPVTTPLLRSSSLLGWTRKLLSSGSSAQVLGTPAPLQTPSTPSSTRKEMVTRWGVLTDTHLHLFDHSSAQLLASLELSKVQLIQSSPTNKCMSSGRRRAPAGSLFPIKIYCNGTMHVLFVLTHAQQQLWEYKIDRHRRQLLIP